MGASRAVNRAALFFACDAPGEFRGFDSRTPNVYAARQVVRNLPRKWGDRIVRRWLDDRAPVARDDDRFAWWPARCEAAWNTLNAMAARAARCFHARISAATSRDEINELADAQAQRCRESITRDAGTAADCAQVQRIVSEWGIEHRIIDAPSLWRCASVKWWRRKLRRLHVLTVERSAVALGIVGGGREKYCSDESVRMWSDGYRATRAWLEKSVIESEDGKRFTLAELADRSPANMQIRRNELMQRVRGIEEYETGRGSVCVFVTLTCPSKFHAMKMRRDDAGRWIAEANPKFDGASARDAQAHLVRTWARVRKDCGRERIKLHGLRVCEPHHDGCPHWHMLVWLPASLASRFMEIMWRAAFAVDGLEDGAERSRIKFELIDSSKGSAVAYIAKYLAKNVPQSLTVSGQRVIAGMDDAAAPGDDVVTAARKGLDVRPMIWARVWGVRQFQFFGSVPVAVWRVARRCEKLPQYLSDIVHRDGERRADWAAFIAQVRRDGITLAREWCDKVTEHGDAVGWRTIGLTSPIGEIYYVVRRAWRAVKIGFPVDDRARFCPVL